MHLSDKVSSNGTEDSTNFLKNQRERRSKRGGKEKHNTVYFGGGLKGMKIARRHLCLNRKLYSNLYGRGCPVLLPCTCISDLDH